jgi:SAM-dependent methyltransferase
MMESAVGFGPHQRDWNELAEMDPLWAILSAPNKRYGKWDVEEFLESGEHQIEDALQHGKKLGFPLSFESALDFGCGVGRLTRALAGRFKTCVGVDISPAMIQQARRLNADRPGCTFVLNTTDDLAFASDRSFDLIYCDIVLQHLPSHSTIGRYIREFVRVLRPDGLLVFQLPSHIPLRHRFQLRRRLYAAFRFLRVPNRFLYERLGLYPIRMSSLPESEVVQLLEGEGAKVLEVERSIAGNSMIDDRRYWVTRS